VCKPANHVGGDYFDYFESAGSLDIAIADVSGHSVGAALMMTVLRSMLRAEARKGADFRLRPNSVLKELNEFLYEDLTKSELFITIFYCHYEPANRLLRFANGGHNTGLLLRLNENRCRQLDCDGLVLGVKPLASFEECSVSLQEGDKMLLYTDGVTEAASSGGSFYGVDRLSEAFRGNRRLAPQLLVDAILDDLNCFCDHAPQSDDIAIVVMEIH
jgi:phosphoserine phosphatase RsbU/P